MYTMIIADDETIERKVLKKLINRQYPYIKVIGEASNGEEAVQMCCKVQPDIVIMDIKMPIINGIEASAMIKRKSGHTRVIISSAYSDYDYMVGAINLGVDKYLLKPYDTETLNTAINYSINEIVKEQKNKQANQNLNQKLNNALPLVENQFVMSAINGSLLKEELKEYYRMLNKDFKNGIVIIFGLKDDEDQILEGGERINAKFKNVFRYIHDEMHKSFSCAMSIISANKIAAVISSKEIKKEYSIKTYIFKTANSICANVEKLYKDKMDVGISEPYKGINNLAYAYKRADRYLTVSDNAGFINECSNKMHAICNIDKYPTQKEKNLSFAIKAGNKKLYQQYIDELFAWFESIRDKANCFVIAKVYMNSLISNIQKLIINKLDLTREYEILDINVYNQAETIEDILALKDVINRTVDQVMDVLSGNGANKMDRIITNAEKYISNFYYEEITLEDLAENALLSPQYFSKIFKEKTGETFVKYLKKIRMEKSNELLENSEMPAADICYKVGYNDPDYFFKVYKNYFHITPSEYRKKIQ